MDFVCITVAAQVGEDRVGYVGCGDVFSGKEGWQPSLPVLVLAFDLAFGLWGPRIAQGDAVEVKGSPELGQGIGALGKEQTVAIDIKFQRQAMLAKRRGQEVKISQETLAMINRGPGADA
jgi:hypothetical protein